VPLLNITHNASTAQHGLSTGRKLGIAFGSVIAFGFFAGLLILLYLILYHRLRARARTRSWKRHLNLRRLYLNRGGSHRKRDDDDSNVSNTDGPYPEESLGADTSMTDPFAVFAVDFTVPPLEMSKSTITAKSMGVRRENGWRNFEDYDYI
jgi:hypothetical protein